MQVALRREFLSLHPYRRAVLIQVALLSGLLASGAAMAWTGIRIPVFHASLYLFGIPDPMCGMRTGTLALMQGDVLKALQANPLSIVFVPFVIGLITERLYRVRTARPPRPWTRHERRILPLGLLLILMAAWIYQLFRFGII